MSLSAQFVTLIFVYPRIPYVIYFPYRLPPEPSTKERGSNMAMLNNESALKFAKELTTTAIENKMIAADRDAKSTAENVFEFYKTLYEKLSGKTAE